MILIQCNGMKYYDYFKLVPKYLISTTWLNLSSVCFTDKNLKIDKEKCDLCFSLRFIKFDRMKTF